MTEQWVVTYDVEVPGGSLVVEFYRGARAECLRIQAQSGAGTDDCQPTRDWRPNAGPAEPWDEFLRSRLACGIYAVTSGD